VTRAQLRRSSAFSGIPLQFEPHSPSAFRHLRNEVFTVLLSDLVVPVQKTHVARRSIDIFQLEKARQNSERLRRSEHDHVCAIPAGHRNPDALVGHSCVDCSGIRSTLTWRSATGVSKGGPPTALLKGRETGRQAREGRNEMRKAFACFVGVCCCRAS
jgi:hypothetical protein